MRELNKKYRGLNASTDALSFKFDKTGEILFSLNDIRKKSIAHHLPSTIYLSYLLIHALLHLKGLTHGSKMERQEKKYCKIFQIKHPTDESKNNSRHRYRHAPS